MIRPLKEAIAELEFKLIDEALRETGGDIKRASELLQVVRAHLYRRIDLFDIDPDTYRSGKAPKKAVGKKAGPKKAAAKKAGKKAAVKKPAKSAGKKVGAKKPAKKASKKAARG